MRCQIQLKERLAGFAATSARPGEVLSVCTREFTSSEDGDHFIQRLDGMQECLISRVPRCPSPSVIDHFLAVIAPDLRATIVVNELQPRVLMKPRRAMKKGDVVRLDDILDVRRMELGVSVPSDHAVVFIHSHGWRKGLYFDFEPLLQPPKARDHDLGALLGLLHSYLLFQDQFKITDEQWHCLFDQHWFPFRYLPLELVKRMLRIAREGWPVDEILQDAALPAALASALDSPESRLPGSAFAEHRELLLHAFQRYSAGDYKSAVAILYPRIEGVLRSIHAEDGVGKPNSATMVNSATARYERALGESTLLMPAKFREFLSTVYFRKWHAGDQPAHVSRHTVSHGVAPSERFDQKSALIGILTVLQIGLYMDADSPVSGAQLDKGGGAG